MPIGVTKWVKQKDDIEFFFKYIERWASKFGKSFISADILSLKKHILKPINHTETIKISVTNKDNKDYKFICIKIYRLPKCGVCFNFLNTGLTQLGIDNFFISNIDIYQNIDFLEKEDEFSIGDIKEILYEPLNNYIDNFLKNNTFLSKKDVMSTIVPGNNVITDIYGTENLFVLISGNSKGIIGGILRPTKFNSFLFSPLGINNVHLNIINRKQNIFKTLDINNNDFLNNLSEKILSNEFLER